MHQKAMFLYESQFMQDTVTAIIDTGSQLNIAHRRVWKQALAHPIDMHQSVNMSMKQGRANKEQTHLTYNKSPKPFPLGRLELLTAEPYEKWW